MNADQQSGVGAADNRRPSPPPPYDPPCAAPLVIVALLMQPVVWPGSRQPVPGSRTRGERRTLLVLTVVAAVALLAALGTAAVKSGLLGMERPTVKVSGVPALLRPSYPSEGRRLNGARMMTERQSGGCDHWPITPMVGPCDAP